MINFYVKKRFVQILFVIFMCINLCLFFSCSASAKSISLSNQFDVIDSLINHNQMNAALKELKKTEKRAFDSWTCIGIFKRYIMLGEDLRAENYIKKSIKKNPKNEELCVIYTNYLLRKNRFADAEEVSTPLKDSRYASFYAEAVFQNHLAELEQTEKKSLYSDEKYFDLFINSYNVSKNPVWLRNCAAFFVSRGHYEQASNLTPSSYHNTDDAYFWALVNFDAGKYYDSINALQSAERFLESMKKKSTSKTSDIKIAALESDAYTAISDFADAEQIRNNLLKEYMLMDAPLQNLSDEEKKVLPLIFVNSAQSAFENGDDFRGVSFLTFAVSNFPECVPALISYADFAYNSNLGRREDDELVALRKAGIKTREMERYDSRAKLPLSDAISRIDRALLTVNDPYLYIARLDLRYKIDDTLTERDKTADLWRLLEETSTETVKYHDILVLYTVNFLLSTGQVSDAEVVFKKYMTDKFMFDENQKTSKKKEVNPEEEFYKNTINVLRSATVPDIEVAAWFAANSKNVSETLRMYEYCVFESSGLGSSEVSSLVSAEAAMNLADVYYSIGKKDAALDLYGKIAARETRLKVRSEIFYRIAAIYSALGDSQNALRAADYSYSLNPENVRARLLRAKSRQ